MIFFIACSDDIATNYSPSIGLEEVEVVKKMSGTDSLLLIRFWYEDKDGDLGLRDGDTTNEFKGFNNLIINFREKRNGAYVPLTLKNTNIPVNFNQRIPNLTPTGKNKEISGSMTVSFGVDPNEIHADTVEFDLKIIDRNFNESNIIEATDVSLIQE